MLSNQVLKHSINPFHFSFYLKGKKKKKNSSLSTKFGITIVPPAFTHQEQRVCVCVCAHSANAHACEPRPNLHFQSTHCRSNAFSICEKQSCKCDLETDTACEAAMPVKLSTASISPFHTFSKKRKKRSLFLSSSGPLFRMVKIHFNCESKTMYVPLHRQTRYAVG